LRNSNMYKKNNFGSLDMELFLINFFEVIEV